LLLLRLWLLGASPMPSKYMFLMVSLAGFLQQQKPQVAYHSQLV
jgi:hypothetical protein